MSLPKTQVGYGYVDGATEIVKFNDLPVPIPQGKQVLLKIEAAGLCHSDINILGLPNAFSDKFVMGHEIAGQIAMVGDDLKDSEVFQEGKRFCVTIVKPCEICKPCRQGIENGCVTRMGYGINSDGGFQEYLLIDNIKTLIPIPDNVSYAEAAVATDSVLTPYHAISKVQSDMKPTSKVLIIGAGGLGLNALQIVKNYGCHVVVTDKKAELGEKALKLGADEFIHDLNTTFDHEPESFDVIFDFCGYRTTFELAQKFVATGGKIVMIGLGNYKLQLRNFDMATRSVTLFFNFGGVGREQEECLRWIEKGIVKPAIKMAPLHELPLYMKRINEGKVEGRIVFKPKL
ncbi:alcohol dehydrogenase 1 [[Candida] jaroonii]|uniref:Alcohol dehydrogenase 1 n=1 Tax=[Candida] jaroonii TaxID=467808 RepID=A0ACA9Y6N9_9ASCO|nr:alcohol dehydrogenase 1 [[Candida] jaroonii]